MEMKERKWRKVCSATWWAFRDIYGAPPSHLHVLDTIKHLCTDRIGHISKVIKSLHKVIFLLRFCHKRKLR